MTRRIQTHDDFDSALVKARMESGDFAGAIADLESVGNEMRLEVVWIELYAESLYQSGSLDKLLEFLDHLGSDGDVVTIKWRFQSKVWIRRGHYKKAVEFPTREVLLDSLADPCRVAKVFFVHSLAWHRLGERLEARKSLERARVLYEKSGSLRELADTLVALAVHERVALDWLKAEAHLERAIEIYSSIASKSVRVAIQNLGVLRAARGQFSLAESALRSALQQALELEDVHRTPTLHAMLALVQIRAGKLREARTDLAKTLRLVRRSGHTQSMLLAAEYCGEYYLASGKPDRAETWLRRALDGALSAGAQDSVGETKRLLAEVALLRSDPSTALALTEEALDVFSASEDVYEIAVTKRVLGQVFLAQGRAADAKDTLREAMDALGPAGELFESERTQFLLDAATAANAATATDAANSPGSLSITNIRDRTAPTISSAGSQLTHHPSFPTIIGTNRRLLDRLTRAARQARTNAPILISGETGTGKELLASAIHDLSGRTGRFIAINCGTTSLGTLESELFGHVRGAFTGAASSRKGLVAEAHQGTLFLDEIAELPQDAQPLLLRLLDSGEARPVGADDSSRFDIRLLAATHQDLNQATEEGRFRRDLLYRISSFRVEIPPLRDRLDDLEKLVDHFVREARVCGYPEFGGVPASVISEMRTHTWPGNMRELRHAVLRLADSVEDAGPGDGGPDPFCWMSEGERPITLNALLEVLQSTRGNVTEAARAFNTSRKTIHRRLKSWGIVLDSFR